MGFRKVGNSFDDSLARLRVTVENKHRERIAREALPDETFEQTEKRLKELDAAKVLQETQAQIQARAFAVQATPEELKLSSSCIRKAPQEEGKGNFFVPGLYDVAGRDKRSLMDVAVYRLSKRDKRAGEVIHYELSDGFVEVTAGPYGMASVWDYDIVLMIVSHLTEATNRFREGKGEKPGRTFTPHVNDILRFSRRGRGQRQAEEIESALDRLKGTTIKSVREHTDQAGLQIRQVDSESLISGYSVLSRTDTGRIDSVEIEAPRWMYEEIVEGRQPDVLTVHPDYFLIEPGVGRFIYRLARRAAGKGIAKWSFRTLYQRSGSTGTFKEFCRMLRKIIAADDLPEYELDEEEGQSGPQLTMRNRAAFVLPRQ
jgi:plasmid replication initiation protein